MSVERLALPTLLDGPFEHAIIGTYGADLVFFEHHLARKLHRIRNKVILIDDFHLADASRRATDARLRGLNAAYVLSAIRSPRAAHQKFILLLGQEAGRLFVGSGNLNFTGYATQGEMFCRYDFTEEDPNHLGSFLAIKEFLEGLEQRGYLHPVTVRHIRAAWRDSPWIYGSDRSDPRVVIHNLKATLLDQLADVVRDGGPIAEMTVFAPFYDEHLVAVRALMKRLKPARTTLLVQQGATSIDPAQLSALKSKTPSLQVCCAEAEIGGTYLHAKFVLLRQRRRTVCLQGSANMSRAALLLREDPGNVELANLLVGPHAEFGSILEGLELSEPVRSVEALDLGLVEDDLPDDEGGVYLLGATWAHPWLDVQASRDLSGTPLTLRVGEADCDLEAEVSGAAVRFEFDETTAELLSQHRTVSLMIRDPDGEYEAGPVFPYIEEALRSLLTRGSGAGSLLDRAGSLTVDDDDVLALLQELQNALPIDAVSIWRIAKRRDPAPVVDDDAPRVRWEELDWEQIRRHPRIAQYGMYGSSYPEPTELQLILDSITNHFRTRGRLATVTTDPEGTDADLAKAETEEELEERDRQRRSIESRNRSAWKRFINKMIAGLSDPDYVDRVGPMVVVTNFVIFNHILSLLIARDHIDADFGVDSQLQLWEFMWGSGEDSGLIATLDPEVWSIVDGMLRERGAYAMTLAGLYRASMIMRVEDWDEEWRTALRDIWRRMLESERFTIDSEVFDEAAAEVLPPDQNATTELMTEIGGLARVVVRDEFVATLARLFGVSPQQLQFRAADVERRGKKFPTVALYLDRPGAVMEVSEAARALALWRELQPERDYYRIDDVAGRTVAVCDAEFGENWWASKTAGELQALKLATEPLSRWQQRLEALQELVPEVAASTA